MTERLACCLTAARAMLGSFTVCLHPFVLHFAANEITFQANLSYLAFIRVPGMLLCRLEGAASFTFSVLCANGVPAMSKAFAVGYATRFAGARAQARGSLPAMLANVALSFFAHCAFLCALTGCILEAMSKRCALGLRAKHTRFRHFTRCIVENVRAFALPTRYQGKRKYK
jgi:hypothetical protein